MSDETPVVPAVSVPAVAPVVADAAVEEAPKALKLDQKALKALVEKQDAEDTKTCAQEIKASLDKWQCLLDVKMVSVVTKAKTDNSFIVDVVKVSKEG